MDFPSIPNIPSVLHQLQAEPVEIPTDCPLLSEIGAEITADDQVIEVVLLQFYGPHNPGPDATAYVRTQFFGTDGRLRAHYAESYRGPSLNELAKAWLRIPGTLRATEGVSRVKAAYYPRRSAS